MKSANKKLYELEKNVLPDHPKDAQIYIENKAEIELNKRVNLILFTDFNFFRLFHNLDADACTQSKIFIFHAKHINMVINLGMGKSTKKKPLTKKERDEKRKKRKEKQPK